MFSKPNASNEDRLATLRAQLATAEKALRDAQIVRGSFEALRNGIAFIDPIELERADAALLAARNHVRGLQVELSEAEAAVKLERERPQREKAKRELDAVAADLAKDLKVAITAMQRFAATLDRVPVNVIATLAPSEQQILARYMPASAEFVAGDVPVAIVNRLRAYGDAMVAGQYGASLGLSIIEQDVAFGKRRAA